MQKSSTLIVYRVSAPATVLDQSVEFLENPRGMELARGRSMQPARKITELVAWQLASQLSDLIAEIASRPAARRHPKLSEQIVKSSASVPANLAEGFGRFHPRENAGFVQIAKASLTETQNHLLHGKRRGCWKADDYTNAWRLSCRTMKAIVPYLLYLEGCNGEVPERSQ